MRAFTLLETVAATALLTTIVVACLPLLDATRRDTLGASESARSQAIAAMDLEVERTLAAEPEFVRKLLEHEGRALHLNPAEPGDQPLTATLEALVPTASDRNDAQVARVRFRRNAVVTVRWISVPQTLPEDPQ